MIQASAQLLDDPIVARATAPGAGALAVIRLDGRGAAGLVERLFRPAGDVGPVQAPRRAVFGRWVAPENGEVLDEGITVFFAGPASYTGNDLAEFFCHGGPIPSARLIEAALALGARLAEPGEFTRRAYLNGKLDLAQAEAVADLINAQTERAARLAGAQLAGGLSARIEVIRRELIALAAEIEARIDFPDEDLEAEDRRRLEAIFERALAETGRLIETRQRGRILREGARVVLVGAPNAGKSSLLNALTRMERAIVTPHPGTTRDTIECTVDLKGIPLTLIDTAGLRESADPMERIGIERAWREIERADLVVLVHDASLGAPGAWGDGAPIKRRPDLTVFNKIDLVPDGAAEWGASGTGEVVAVSCTRGEGLAELETRLADRLLAGAGAEDDLGLAINLRHYELLAAARDALGAARAGFGQMLSGELVMVDLHEALDALGQIVGKGAGEEILDLLFSRFCIGK